MFSPTGVNVGCMRPGCWRWRLCLKVQLLVHARALIARAWSHVCKNKRVNQCYIHFSYSSLHMTSRTSLLWSVSGYIYHVSHVAGSGHHIGSVSVVFFDAFVDKGWVCDVEERFSGLWMRKEKKNCKTEQNVQRVAHICCNSENQKTGNIHNGRSGWFTPITSHRIAESATSAYLYYIYF